MRSAAHRPSPRSMPRGTSVSPSSRHSSACTPFCPPHGPTPLSWLPSTGSARLLLAVNTRFPERVAGLVSLATYAIIEVERLRHAYEPSVEHAVWYQHPFQTGRGRDCLASHRRELCRMLWRQWSPDRRFEEVSFERTARSCANPDFVDVVIHAYRHAFGLAAGDPAYEGLEERLTRRPRISV